jgi:hypothetical protein
MRRYLPHITVLSLLASVSVSAQEPTGLPTTQPTLLTIVREEVKLGRSAEHSRLETGWPAAFERAKSKSYYLAMTSMTGPNEAWYVIPQQSHAAMAADMRREEGDDVLSTELRRLSRADAELINSYRTIQARARPDLSQGAFPDMNQQRFWEISIFRVRPGHEMQFDSAAKAYQAAAKRNAPDLSWRVYEVMAGMPGPTYLIFSSVKGFEEFDAMMASSDKLWRGAAPAEFAQLQRFFAEGLISAETNRFRLDPQMSFVSREVRMADADFWMPKTRAAAKPRLQSATQRP